MIKCDESELQEPVGSASESKTQQPKTQRRGADRGKPSRADRGKPSPYGSRPWSVVIFLTLVGIFLVCFAGQFVYALMQAASSTAPIVPVNPPLLGLSGAPFKSFDLPAQRTMLYVQGNNVYSVTTKATTGVTTETSVNGTDQSKTDAVSQPLQIQTPGYSYNPSLPPLVTPARQLIYAGTGLWMTDLVHNQARQIAAVGDNQEVTSLVLSRDGSQVAWSIAPKDGQGKIQIFAGPIGSTKLVYQQVAGGCPCFHVFSFWSTSAVVGHDTLLLTDDHGDDGPVEHGLWIFPLNEGPLVRPTLVIRSDPPQGPLALSPDNTNLLYTTYDGNVPAPSDMPEELSTVEYANSLVVGTLQNTSPYLRNTHVVLPEQTEQLNSARYHWVMSPSFSPAGQTLVYVEFSADSQLSFTRTNALYMVQMQGSAAPTRPTLIATTAAHYVELGSWWDVHTVTVFIDKGFYALDVQRGVLAPIIQTGGYAHEIAVLN